MKIIAKDNYDRETISDYLVAENLNDYYGKMITNLLNRTASDTFYEAVEDDYKLYDASTMY